jgi:hypothetical protein
MPSISYWVFGVVENDVIVPSEVVAISELRRVTIVLGIPLPRIAMARDIPHTRSAWHRETDFTAAGFRLPPTALGRVSERVWRKKKVGMATI